MKKRKIKPYSRKKRTIIISVSIFLLVLASVLLTVGATIGSPLAVKIFVPAFFIINIIDIVFISFHLKGLTLGEIAEQTARTKEESLYTVKNYADPQAFCNTRRFDQKKVGYLHKKRFTFRDFVNYYVKIVKSDSVEKTVENEFFIFEKLDFVFYPSCLILFIEKPNVTDEDLDYVTQKSNEIMCKEIGKRFIQKTAIIVLLDENGKTAYTICNGRNKMSFYASAFRYVKKIISPKNK